MVKNGTLVVVGISGASGSGKSSLAEAVVKGIGSDKVAVISEDSYYRSLSHLSMEERAKVNFDHPSAFEYDLLMQHINQLRDGMGINVPIYDYKVSNRSQETIRIDSCTIVLLEGILVFANEALRNSMDIKIFIDAPLDLCLFRRIKRDIKDRGATLDEVMKQYMETVRPMFKQFIAPSKKYADIIIPFGGKNIVAIEVIRARLLSILGLLNVELSE